MTSAKILKGMRKWEKKPKGGTGEQREVKKKQIGNNHT
jgi:hypothetical protein